MELTPNMYVRYKTLSNRIKIAKIIEIDKKVLDLDNKDCTTEKYIIGEPSHNLIDLIEPGDYVNGVQVIDKEIDNLNEKYLQCGVGDYVICTYNSNEIEDVVTKEQFSAMEYKID